MNLKNMDIEHRGYRVKSIETSLSDVYMIGVFDRQGNVPEFVVKPLPHISTQMLDETIQSSIEDHKQSIDHFLKNRSLYNMVDFARRCDDPESHPIEDIHRACIATSSSYRERKYWAMRLLKSKEQDDDIG